MRRAPHIDIASLGETEVHNQKVEGSASCSGGRHVTVRRRLCFRCGEWSGGVRIAGFISLCAAGPGVALAGLLMSPPAHADSLPEPAPAAAEPAGFWGSFQTAENWLYGGILDPDLTPNDFETAYGSVVAMHHDLMLTADTLFLPVITVDADYVAEITQIIGNVEGGVSDIAQIVSGVGSLLSGIGAIEDHALTSGAAAAATPGTVTQLVDGITNEDGQLYNFTDGTGVIGTAEATAAQYNGVDAREDGVLQDLGYYLLNAVNHSLKDLPSLTNAQETNSSAISSLETVLSDEANIQADITNDLMPSLSTGNAQIITQDNVVLYTLADQMYNQLQDAVFALNTGL